MENKIIEPNIDLIKSDEFYLFYEMMMQSLKTDNVKEGINTSLVMLRNYLNSGHISLYKKNQNGKYVLNLSDSPLEELGQFTSCIVNKTQNLSEENSIFEVKLNLSKKIKNLMLLHIKMNETDHLVAINNYDENKKLESLFWERLRDTILIILKRAASYEKNMAAITTDLLTGLDNRNSYEMKLKEIEKSDEKKVFAIFDLFRLKYVNDNYSHVVGDEYIKQTAQILSKYWPKYRIILEEDGIEKYYETGHTLFRVGGDEYILITGVEDIQLTKVKANLAALEVQNLKLVKEKLPLGINAGIILHNPGDSIKDTYTKADDMMGEDKKQMYLKYGLERRR